MQTEGFKKKQTLKYICINAISKLITSGHILLPSLQLLGSDLLEQLCHFLHSEKKLTSDDLILSLISPNLHTLNLSLCYHLKDEGFEIILKKCPQLVVINIASCHAVSNDGIKMIGKYNHQLEALNVSNCHTITSDSVSYSF